MLLTLRKVRPPALALPLSRSGPPLNRSGSEARHSRTKTATAGAQTWTSELEGARRRTLALLLASSHSPRRLLLGSCPPTTAPKAQAEAAAAAAANHDGEGARGAQANNGSDEGGVVRPHLGRPRQTLAHRLMANLASLTYHHLSPHTRMQPLSRRRARAEQKPRPLSSLARMLNKNDGESSAIDDAATAANAATGSPGAVGAAPNSSSAATDWLAAEADVAGIINATADRLEILRIPPKPVLGPLGGRLRTWDAQNPDKFRYAPQEAASSVGVGGGGGSSTTSSSIAERDIEVLQRGLSDLKARKEALLQSSSSRAAVVDRKTASELKQIDKQAAKMEREVKELEHKMRVRSKNATRQDRAQRIQSIAIDLLADVVNRAQTNEKIWIGKSRWEIRRRGGWLPP
ncbi:uncharacterized protein PFL1_05821 [Pseudozyma flocculosa PF-1]|uniref:Uncharacterized protein n=1 Tax=Pseudozyma flocculosa PF-1 TaxID=1277687 RepID=A0A061H2P4_9BASI|nr:uncharacterized protein PFL1_05821 [Pseudozyma flocculosa PF-1]EPQ26499.1 hypothetical protein PFL1_05821 [Pseudozyma flocculosa PF-1]